ncbi:MAG: Wzz/FepE/Etk N-terminal domain-containing protein [Candidatus Latescibacterota bacterium]
MDEQNRNGQYIVEDENDFGIIVSEWMRFFWINRFIIVTITAVFGIIGIVHVLIQPKQYTATATILPPQASDAKLTGLLSSLGGFAGEVSASISQLYPDVVKSRTVQQGLLDADYKGKTFRSLLQMRFKFKDNIDDNLIKVLQNSIVKSSVTMRTYVFTLRVTYTDPEIAAALANELLAQMEVFFKYQYKSIATSQRVMIEKRLGEVTDSLKVSEDRLLQFRESNRTTVLSPKLQMHEGRLMREVQINNTVYIELNRQNEVSKIAEMQLKPVLNILDLASPPITKSNSSRKKIVFVFMLIGFGFAIGGLKLYPLIREYLVMAIKTYK